jgi:hypothetical protein
MAAMNSGYQLDPGQKGFMPGGFSDAARGPDAETVFNNDMDRIVREVGANFDWASDFDAAMAGIVIPSRPVLQPSVGPPVDTWNPPHFFGGRVKAAYGRYIGGFQSAMVPVQAHGGEYIMSARAVQNIGLSKLESMNHTRNYQGGGGGGTNIFVENFIGEPEWFESMMSDYNVSVAPKNERSRGLESRKISSMADNNRRGRV